MITLILFRGAFVMWRFSQGLLSVGPLSSGPFVMPPSQLDNHVVSHVAASCIILHIS